MGELSRKSLFMDYRNVVPSLNLSEFIVKQPFELEIIPSISLSDYLLRKKVSFMISIRRFKYKKAVEGCKDGRS